MENKHYRLIFNGGGFSVDRNFSTMEAALHYARSMIEICYVDEADFHSEIIDNETGEVWNPEYIEIKEKTS